jgi:ABC-type transport system substrate-binding protein
VIPALAQSEATPPPQPGGSLTLGQMGDIFSLDPHNFSFLNYAVIAQLYDRLAHYVLVDGQWELQPELAETWSVSDDGLTLTMQLRQGVLFHNGREMTADDVVANYEKSKNPDTGAHLYQATLSVTSATANGPYEVVVQHDRQTPEMFDTMSRMSIVAPESFETLNQSGIGTGPFKFVEWVPVDHVAFERNEDYWDPELPYLDELTLKPYNDQAAMQIALQSGDIQAVIGVPYQDAERLSEEVHVIPGQTGATWYTLYASSKQPPFDNQQLRKALQYVINRPLIVESILFGYGEAIWTPWPENSLAFDSRWTDFYPYDLEQASQLITDAGFPDGFEADIISPTAYPELGDMALVLQADLDQIGVTLNYSALGSEWSEMLQSGEYNLTFSFAGRSHLDPVGAFDNSAFRSVNNPLFPDGNPPAAYVEAVTTAKSTLDPDARREALITATEILLEESFAMSVSWRYTLFATQNNVHGFGSTADDFVVMKNVFMEG